MDIKISFIIPVYNIKDYIVCCVNSILNQKEENIEIIIVNDGSTDNVEPILDNIKKNNNNIIIVSKENGGLSSARNAGLKVARGKYIWFVDGDDFIDAQAISLLKNVLLTLEYDIITFNYYKDYNEYKKEIIEKYCETNNNSKILINTSPCTKIFKREFLKSINFAFDEGIIYEDLAVIPYVMSKTSKILYIDSSLYNYVFRTGSIMNSNHFNVRRDNKFTALELLFDKFRKDNSYDAFFDELEYLMIRHLLLVYSTEILIYSSNIYKGRLNKALKTVENYNKKWIKNKYLKNDGIFTRVYLFLLKQRLFWLCKIATQIKLKK